MYFADLLLCQELPRVKQKAITGNSFVDRPLRLLCREADSTDCGSRENPDAWQAWYSR